MKTFLESIWPQWFKWDMHSTGDLEAAGLVPMGQGNSFREIDHELFSMISLSLLPIQEG